MSNSFIYLKSATQSGGLNADKLKQEVEQALTGFTVMNVVDAGEELAVVLDQELTNRTQLDSVVFAHNHLSAKQVVKYTVKAAIEFGNNLVVDFASENVLMGITQAGKTKEVADYLADLMRYAQTGSLYEVIAEIDRLIAAGLPTNLEPFITESRMNTFKQQVIDYLS